MCNEKIRELATVNNLTASQIILEELKDLKRSLALEVDFARDRRQAQEHEFRDFMNELWGTLREIQARFRIDATLLGLIEPEKARIKGPLDDEEKDLNQELTDWH